MSSGGGGADSRDLAQFALSSSTALKIQKGDITRWFVDGSSDAIVNPANELLIGDGRALPPANEFVLCSPAVHIAAGPGLLDACYKVPIVRPGVRCPTGKARITPGFKLPASHVIHAVGPIYNVDGDPKGSLTSAYENSLKLAKEKNIQYIAFAAISCGIFRYPVDEAAKIAISTCKEFGDGMKEVHFVLFSDEIYDAWLNEAKKLLQK